MHYLGAVYDVLCVLCTVYRALRPGLRLRGLCWLLEGVFSACCGVDANDRVGPSLI